MSKHVKFTRDFAYSECAGAPTKTARAGETVALANDLAAIAVEVGAGAIVRAPSGKSKPAPRNKARRAARNK